MPDHLEQIEGLKKLIVSKSREIEAAFKEGDQVSAQKLLDEIDELKARIEDTKTLQMAENSRRMDDLTAMLKRFENEPTLRNSGYTTMDGGTADPKNKSFADFLLAIMRKDDRRLKLIYSAVKDMSEGSAVAGGYLVPTEYLAPLLAIEAEVSAILPKVTRVPVKGDHGVWPALDQYFAPTAGGGGTALAGRITATATAEKGALTETQPQLVELEYTVHKEGGYVEVSNELIADSPMAIDTLLRRLFAIAIAAKKERHILRGSGAGEPLGVLNATCAVASTTTTDNVFAYADALKMKSRFKKIGGAPIWVIHPGVWPDIGVFEVTSGSGGVFQANLQGALGSNLLGYPIVESEHMPQANGDDVILGDFSAYVMFEREELTIAYSEHAAFVNDKGTWRFTSRFDGQPWLKSAITLADPTGSYTVSPFVYHDD